MHFLPLSPAGITPRQVLSIAGSDSGGGAGIEADLRTFALTGVHGAIALTAVTAQNSLGVQGIYPLPEQFVSKQIDSVLTDLTISAVKTGMLANAHIIGTVAQKVRQYHIGKTGTIPLLVDPVSASMHGDPLLEYDALDALRYDLLPQATITTPNLDEVKLLTGIEVTNEKTVRQAAEIFLNYGVQWVIIKGGHLRQSEESPDYVISEDQVLRYTSPRFATTNDHGGGDTLGSAIIAALAHGYSVPDAVEFAKQWITRSVAESYPLGSGHGPVSPLWRLRE